MFDWVKFGFEPQAKGAAPTWFKQVHGPRCIDLDSLSPGLPPLPEADAGFTRHRGRRIYVFTADCIPVLLHGSTPDAPIAAVHAGWRGALSGVVQATLAASGLAPISTHAILGPCIGPCCFEVRQDFVAAWDEAGIDIGPFLLERGAKVYCDLVAYVTQVALGAIPSTQKHIDGRCTVCTTPALPSFRRNKGTNPQIKGWIEKALP